MKKHGLRLFTASLVTSLSILGATAAPASAQPLVTGGLVNVTVNDVTILEDVRVGVALNLAANICGVAVGVLAQQLESGTATCETATQVVEITQ